MPYPYHSLFLKKKCWRWFCHRQTAALADAAALVLESTCRRPDVSIVVVGVGSNLIIIMIMVMWSQGLGGPRGTSPQRGGRAANAQEGPKGSLLRLGQS